MDLTSIVEPSYKKVDESKMSRADQIRECEKELKQIKKDITPYLTIFNEMKNDGVYDLYSSKWWIEEEKEYDRDKGCYVVKDYHVARGTGYGSQSTKDSPGVSARYSEQEKISDYFKAKISPLMKRHNAIVWKLNDLGEPVDKYSLFADKTRHTSKSIGNGYRGYYGGSSRGACINAFNTQEIPFNGYLKCSAKSLIALADKLGYVIIPREFLVDGVEKDGSKAGYSSSVIERFKESLRVGVADKYMDYVMCPINYVDLLKVVSAETMPPLYFSPDLAIYETNLNMTLPLFRSLFMTTSVLEDDVKDIKERLDKIEGANREKTKKEVVRLQDTLKKAAEFNMNSKGGHQCLSDSVLYFGVPTGKSDSKYPTMQEVQDLLVTIGFGIGSEFDDDFAKILGVKNNGITKKSKKIL